MNVLRMVTISVCLLFSIACQNTPDKKTRDLEKEEQAPSIESRKTQKAVPRLNRPRPMAEPQQPEIEKKKRKANDTLKPVVAIP